ncbi:uncharacterized protein Tco025E_01795 [Trypanosoma conorhini]|uniref:Uncharacterized protein n=1 Tax=Trypanosoma conorhini TaxID=83891 RepID=A0A3R7M3L7_9TRYP|nr:uncharacterized protein Tco025E_01795 [Trypanosoma conorhini]RNF25949.1 hypothetical protein Tco025E_01795 [Trypanosoma conorhini]
MARAADSVLFYGAVEKVGTDGSILSRNVCLTPLALLVCLPAGGVTRTVALASVLQLEFTKQDVAGKPRCTIHVRGEAPLTLDFADQSGAGDFADAVAKATGHVRVVHLAGTPLRERQVRSDAPHAAPRGVRLVDPPELSEPSSLAAGNERWLGVPSPSPSVEPGSRARAQTLARPAEALAMVGRRPALGSKAGGARGDGANSDLPPESHASPLRREAFHDPQRAGSQDANGASAVVYDLRRPAESSLYTSDITRPRTAPRNDAGEHATLWQELEGQPQPHVESLHDLRAQRDSLAKLQQRLSTDLELQKQAVGRLSSELQEKNAFIDDLKTALRSQEAVFQEMLRSTEQRRLMEHAKNELEKQVEVLQAEVRHWESLSERRESEYRKELATKLAELHDSHTKEVEAVQGAFAEYDAEMTEYVSSLLTDMDREARKWGEQQRLLQDQIESQQQEIAELTSALAPRRVAVPDSNSASPALADVEAEAESGAGEADCVDEDGKASLLQRRREAARPSRRPTSPATAMSALGQRLASLEEGRARLQLGETLRRYAHRRGHETGSGAFGGHAEREGQQVRGRAAAEAAAAASPQLLQTPLLGQEAGNEAPSRLVSPGESRGVRSRAIL